MDTHRLMHDSRCLVLNGMADHNAPVAIFNQLQLIPNIFWVVRIHQHNLVVQYGGVAGIQQAVLQLFDRALPLACTVVSKLVSSCDKCHSLPLLVLDEVNQALEHNLVRRKRPCEVTVVTDASAYDAGTVVTGTVTVNYTRPMQVSAAPAPAPALAPNMSASTQSYEKENSFIDKE